MKKTNPEECRDKKISTLEDKISQLENEIKKLCDCDLNERLKELEVYTMLRNRRLDDYLLSIINLFHYEPPQVILSTSRIKNNIINEEKLKIQQQPESKDDRKDNNN